MYKYKNQLETIDLYSKKYRKRFGATTLTGSSYS